MNNVVLSGRLTKDVEYKKGASGKQFSKFSLAVNRPFSKDSVDFINCVAFEKVAELLSKYCKKGSKILIEGRIQQETYEVEGVKRITYQIIVNSVEFLDKKEIKNEETEEEFDSDEFPF